MMIRGDRAARRGRFLGFIFVLLTVATVIAPGPEPALATEPQWIWAPTQPVPGGPAGTCYFRRTFSGDGATGGKIEIACDENYVLYVNGLKIGSGDNWKSMDRYDIGPYITPGLNVVAVAALKGKPGPAGMVARVIIERKDQPTDDYSTGVTWKSTPEKHAGWTQVKYNDAIWMASQSQGLLSAAVPWGGQVELAEKDSKPRFQVTREFRVEWIVPAKKTGSLLAMTFNEFGHILASRENGPLLLIRDGDNDGIPESVSNYCEDVKNCQGILALNGEVFVTADGPEGAALYRLSDKDHDGKIDAVKPLVKFAGHMEEHGPHSVSLGPDGLLHVLCGNLTKLAAAPKSSGPYRNFYEGDLVQPRLEDPRGFAMGVKAPGGMILRTDVDGSFVEHFAGGLRNPYGVAMHPTGELLTDDADMESDEGLPWYRPTRVCHLVPGAEFGWRSGWAKWPDYFIDGLPPVLDMGPGSPSGMVVYDHVMYPVRYHKTMFVGDWTQGQILAVSLAPRGSTFVGQSSVFLEGNPLNVTGMDVGPDGWLYFCTGGRGTEGGIHRVVWMGRVPPEATRLGVGLTAALKQPQLYAAYSRQQIAAIKKQMGAAWDRDLPRAAVNRALPADQRTRAMDLMQWFGPFPTQQLLAELSRDRDNSVRAKAASLMGIHRGGATSERLVEMLGDPSPLVARIACESLCRTDQRPAPEKVLPLLASPDRHVAFAARRLLERLPADTWQQAVLESTNKRVLLVGSTALLATSPDKATCRKVLDRCQQLTRGFVSDEDFIDLLRVCELAMIKGAFQREELADWSRLMAAEYPAGDSRINNELIRVLAHLESPYVGQRYFEQTQSNPDMTQRMQLVMHSPQLAGSLSSPQRMKMLDIYEEIRKSPQGAEYGRYLDRVARDFVGKLNGEEQRQVLAAGAKWPSAALGAIAALPKKLDAHAIAELTRLDQSLQKDASEPASRLRIGIAAALARSGDEEAMAHLRRLFEQEPERRAVLAMGLAQQPEGENWPLLVRALPILPPPMATAVLGKLAEVDQRPDAPEPIRQAILLGLKSGDDAGRNAAIAVLENWSEEEAGGEKDSPSDKLAAWQKWFAEKYPNEPAATLPVSNENDKYTLEQLEKYLGGSEGAHGNASRGRAVFAKAKCASCHRFGSQGESLGPDLTKVARRFQRREILESILYPSQVISDQYVSKTVHTLDGKSVTGVVAMEADGSAVVLLSTGDKVKIPKEQIEEIVVSKMSTMPTGLLNELSLTEIADLMSYLSAPPAENLTRRPKDRAER